MSDEQNPTSAPAGSVAAAYSEAEKVALDSFLASHEDGDSDDTEVNSEGTANSDDSESADDSEVVEVEDGGAVEVEGQKFDPAQWDGNPNSLPADMRALFDPIHKTMERGMHAKFQELSALRKELESKLAALSSDPTPKKQHSDDTPPPPPTSDQTWEEQVEAQNARDLWFARKAAEQHFGNSPEAQKVSQLVAQQEMQSRVQRIQAMPEYTQDVGNAMVQIAQSHPYYASMMDNDEGMVVLLHTARLALENANLKSSTEATKQAAAAEAGAKIVKKAGAAKGAVSRPSSTRKATPAETYAKMGYAEAERAALEAWESGTAG